MAKQEFQINGILSIIGEILLVMPDGSTALNEIKKILKFLYGDNATYSHILPQMANRAKYVIILQHPQLKFWNSDHINSHNVKEESAKNIEAYGQFIELDNSVI